MHKVLSALAVATALASIPSTAAAQQGNGQSAGAQQRATAGAASSQVRRSATQVPTAATIPRRPAPAPPQTIAAANDWTVGVAGGQLEGSYIRYAADLARAFDDQPNLRVVPAVTYGAAGNVEDLLYLRGIDLALTQSDTLDIFKKDNKYRDISGRINYVMSLFLSEFHVLARPEIKSMKDLDGKKIGVNVKGSAGGFTAGIVFEKLGIKPIFVNIGHPAALEKMKTGEFAALVHSVGKPNDFFTRTNFEPGYHFLPIELTDALTEYYVPGELTNDDYPALVPKGQAVNTIAVTNVLAAFNWPRESERSRRVARFVEALFTKFDELHKPVYQPKWKDMNLAATVSGWTRLPIAEEILAGINARATAGAQAANAATVMPAATKQSFEQFQASRAQAGLPPAKSNDALFQDYQRWLQSQGR